jgi:hypothetical protein
VIDRSGFGAEVCDPWQLLGSSSPERSTVCLAFDGSISALCWRCEPATNQAQFPSIMAAGWGIGCALAVFLQHEEPNAVHRPICGQACRTEKMAAIMDTQDEESHPLSLSEMGISRSPMMACLKNRSPVNWRMTHMCSNYITGEKRFDLVEDETDDDVSDDDDCTDACTQGLATGGDDGQGPAKRRKTSSSSHK